MKLKTSIILCSVIATTTVPAISAPIWDMYAGLTIGAGAQTVFVGDDNKTNAAQSFGGVFGVGFQWIPTGIMQSAFGTMVDYMDNYTNQQYSQGADDLRNGLKKFRPYLSIALMYRHNFYDYFNQNYHYSATDSYPFEGFSSRFGEIFLRITVGR